MANIFNAAYAGFAVATLVSGAVQVPLTTSASAADENPAQIVAEQIRRQGFQCADPVSATRDVKDSRVHAAVWILDCNGVRYSVQLVPDQAARVVQLQKSK